MGKIAGVEINSADNSLIEILKDAGIRLAGSNATLAWPVMIYLDQSTGISYGAGQPSKNGGGKTCAAINLQNSILEHQDYVSRI